MKTTLRIALVLFLFAAGFAAGFPFGKSAGFDEGSEWAMLQAELFAREAGVFMPVSYEEGQFRIVMRQPGDLYKRAWQLADRHYEMTKLRGSKASARQGSNDAEAAMSGREWERTVTDLSMPVSLVLPKLPEPDPTILFYLTEAVPEEETRM
jgi:hypothetical protein